jgi:hypothetical protein
MFMVGISPARPARGGGAGGGRKKHGGARQRGRAGLATRVK